MTEDSALKRIIAIQRRLGRITLADIKANYPIDAMSSAAIGRTMVRLERAGIDIEFYKALLRRRSDIGRAILPAPHRSRPAALPRAPATAEPSAREMVWAKSTSQVRQAQSGRSVWWMAHAGHLSIAILGLAVLVAAIILAMRP